MKTVGYGKAFASFGEIVQGRLSDGEDFLVTLPVDMWATCVIARESSRGPSEVICELDKSRDAAVMVLDDLGLQRGERLTVTFSRSIPIGKGLSSSTADMLAVVRALQEIYGVIVSEQYISKLFARVEPHDPLHYYMSVAYNHRTGHLLHKLHYIPGYQIVGMDRGGTVDTREYNRHLNFTDDDIRFYDRLLGAVLEAFARKDPVRIAACATEAARRNASRSPHPFFREVLDRAPGLGALGVVTTHSGTCAGLLFPFDTPSADIEKVRDRLSRDTPYECFTTRTLVTLS